MGAIKQWLVGAFILLIMLVLLLVTVMLVINTVQSTVEQTTQKAINPLAEALNPLTDSSKQLNTQVAMVLHPTPTIIPDPITIINEVRSLARLETIQYSVEKVIRAEEGQSSLALLFGDKLIFVAHGTVIAGVDLGKMGDSDIKIDGKSLTINLPEPEVFVSTLNNDKSYVYDRATGIFQKPDSNLETQARQTAEAEVLKAATDDGILDQAKINAENYLARLLRNLGYNEVHFIYHKTGSE
jgi:hypothetical protein